MYYIRMKSTGAINWANAYNTKEDAERDMIIFSNSLGIDIGYDIEFHDKGIYFASMSGGICHDGFKSREHAIRWAYEMFGSGVKYNEEYDTYDLHLVGGEIIMLDLIGGKN